MTSNCYDIELLWNRKDTCNWLSRIEFQKVGTCYWLSWIEFKRYTDYLGLNSKRYLLLTVSRIEFQNVLVTEYLVLNSKRYLLLIISDWISKGTCYCVSRIGCQNFFVTVYHGLNVKKYLFLCILDWDLSFKRYLLLYILHWMSKGINLWVSQRDCKGWSLKKKKKVLQTHSQKVPARHSSWIHARCLKK